MKPRWLNKFHAVDGAIVFNELQIVAVSDDVVLAHDVFQKIIGRFSETDLKARKLRGRGPLTPPQASEILGGKYLGRGEGCDMIVFE